MRSGPVLVAVAAVLAGCATAGSARPVRAAGLDDGVALYNRGKYAEAEQVFRSLQGAEAQAYLAASLARQNKYGEAQPIADAVLKAHANHPIGVAALGNCLVGTKKYDEAVARLSAVIEAAPATPYAYFWRAQAYQQLKQPERMAADFETFLRLAPDSPEGASVKQVLSSFRH